MLGFKQFILEWGDFSFPTATLVKDKTNLSDAQARQELNRNLALASTGHSINPYTDLFRATKVLNLYGIALPKITFTDMEEGEEIVAVDQFGAKSGAGLCGKVEKLNNLDETEYFFYYSYELKDDGHYETKAKIMDADELAEHIEESEDDDIEED